MQAKTHENVGLPGMPVSVSPAGRIGPTSGTENGQNLAMGCAAGAVAALVGAAIWAAISYYTDYQIGWMAVGVGLLVGFAVRQFGKGTGTAFGILGGALALAGCLVGNLLTVCLVLAREKAMPLLDVFSRLDPGLIVNIMTATFSPMDLLFYGLAVYTGYRFAAQPAAEAQPAGTAA